MNINELKNKLIENNISNSEYSLNGGLPSEAFCLERVSKTEWRTYYSERGTRVAIKTFVSEEEACKDLWKRLRQGM